MNLSEVIPLGTADEDTSVRAQNSIWHGMSTHYRLWV